MQGGRVTLPHARWRLEPCGRDSEQACTGGRHSRGLLGVLLAGNPGNGIQVASPELPYSLEQLQQMQAAAAATIASKADIQQCTVVLHEFPIAKCTQCIDVKGQEMQLKQKDLIIDSQRFGLKQKEDEHSLRMDRERAELEEEKRRRFDASTDDGTPSEVC